MAFPQGINFRINTGFVTDVGDEDPEVDVSSGFTVSYPRTTAQGNTVGWESGSGAARDRDSGIDRRLAGLHRVEPSGSGVQSVYRIDLPAAGNYEIRVGAGDASNLARTCHIEVFDNVTSLGVIVNGTTANGFFDAMGTDHTAANWPANNAARTLTFASTICRFQFAVQSGENCIAHIHIAAVGGGGGAANLLLGKFGYPFRGKLG